MHPTEGDNDADRISQWSVICSLVEIDTGVVRTQKAGVFLCLVGLSLLDKAREKVKSVYDWKQERSLKF